MKQKIKFFFFGFGQTAKYFVKELIKSNKKFTFSATNTKKSSVSNFNKRKFKSFKFNNIFFDRKLLPKLIKSKFILVSIHPQKNKDIVLKKFSKSLKTLNFKKLIYSIVL